jgi:hypothetical protein
MALVAAVTIKIPRSTYHTVKALAKKRGCFIGKIISDAVTLYNNTNNPEQSKEQAA